LYCFSISLAVASGGIYATVEDMIYILGSVSLNKASSPAAGIQSYSCMWRISAKSMLQLDFDKLEVLRESNEGVEANIWAPYFMRIHGSGGSLQRSNTSPRTRALTGSFVGTTTTQDVLQQHSKLVLHQQLSGHQAEDTDADSSSQVGALSAAAVGRESRHKKTRLGNSPQVIPKYLFSPASAEGTLFFDIPTQRWVVVSLEFLRPQFRFCFADAIYKSWQCIEAAAINYETLRKNGFMSYAGKAHPALSQRATTSLWGTASATRGSDRNGTSSAAGLKDGASLQVVLSYVTNAINIGDIFQDNNLHEYCPKFLFVSQQAIPEK
jgi:hypothetical protein